MPAEALRAQSDEAGNVTLVAQQERLTGYFRTSPQVAAFGDEVLVGWSTTPCKNLLDYEGDHQVIVAKRTPTDDGTYEWTARGAIDYGSDFEITSLDAGIIGSKPAVAWTYNDLDLTSDGTVTTSTDPSKLVVVTSDDLKEFDESKDVENVDFADKGGLGALTWSEPGTDGTLDLMALTDPNGTPDKLLDDANLPPNYQIDGDLDISALITYQGWESGETQEESTTDIYGRVLKDGASLSEENLLVAHEDDLTSHSVAYVQGSPVVALAAERGVGDEDSDVSRSADLLVAQGDSLERLSVNELVFEVGDVEPNAKVETKVIVDNAGLVPITGGVYAEIIDEHTGLTLGRGSYGGQIAVDEQAQIPVTITVPADFDPALYRDISVKVNFEGERQARDTTALNLDTILYGPELSIREGDDSSKGDGEDAGKEGDKDKGGKRSDTTPSRDGTTGGRSWRRRGTWVYDDGWQYRGGWLYGNAWGWDNGYAHTGSTSTTTPVTTSRSTSGISRISGQDRYDTMRETVLSAFGKSDWAILASGGDFADALAAQALAGARRAPVVLTARDRLSPQARDVLERLGSRHVVVVGGQSAVSEAALSEARSVSGDAVRVAGTDRYATSLAALRAAREAGSASDTVLVATGTDFADALSAGPLSWKAASPVVLVGPDGTLGADALSAIRSDPRIRRVVLLGGESVVSEAVRSQLGSGYTYVRLGGKDRYQTSTAVASWAATQGLGWANPHVATGADFADALAGAAAAGSRSSCLLLADGASSPTLAELKGHAGEVRSVTLLGGKRALAAEVEDFVEREVIDKR